MLGKLMKYELKAMGRVQLPLYAALVVITILNALVLRFNPTADGTILFIIPVLTMMLYMFCIFATLAMNTILSIMRFHKNILGAEGYLTHTLPVSTAQNILSKLFSVVLFQIISIAVALFSGFLLLIVTANMDVTFFGEFFRAIWLNLDKIRGEWVLCLVELTMLGLVTVAFGVLMIYASMAIGYAFNRHKILKSIGVYVLLYNIIILLTTVSMTVFFGPANGAFMELLSASGPAFQANVLMGIGSGALLLGCVVFFGITNYFLKHKLNLE